MTPFMRRMMQSMAVPTTWNPADMSGALAASGGNMTVTHSGAGVWGGARASNPIPPGSKIYFEVTLANVGSNQAVGIGNALEGLSNFFGVDTNGVAGISGTNILLNNASLGNFGTTVANGDIYRVAIDLVNMRIWMARNSGTWNLSGTANPATNTGGYSISGLAAGPYYPGISFFQGGQATANFGASAYSFTPPAGFFNMP